MSYSKKAIDSFMENIEPGINAAADPEKYNLLMGLIYLAKAISGIEKRIDGLEERIR